MLKTENGNITVTYGDSAELTITPLQENTEPYFLSEGETVRFLVKLHPWSKPKIDKKISEQSEDGSIIVRLEPKDTRIPRTSYVCEVKLYSADENEICTFIGGDEDKPLFTVV